MSAQKAWTLSDRLEVGDRVTIDDVPIHREWWQFWKPKIVGHRSMVYEVTATVSTSPGTEARNGSAISSRLAVERVTATVIDACVKRLANSACDPNQSEAAKIVLNSAAEALRSDSAAIVIEVTGALRD
jgi:hypothetical protein